MNFFMSILHERALSYKKTNRWWYNNIIETLKTQDFVFQTYHIFFWQFFDSAKDIIEISNEININCIIFGRTWIDTRIIIIIIIISRFESKTASRDKSISHINFEDKSNC